MPRLLRITDESRQLMVKPETKLITEVRGDSERNKKFIDDIWNRYHDAFPPDQRINYGPDSSFTQIELVHGRDTIVAGSWHVGDSEGNLIATAHGLEGLDGRRREDVLAAQPAAYRRFREAFDAIVKEAAEFARRSG